MKTTIVNRLFAAAFMLLLLAPLLFVHLKGGEVSELENRLLASRPGLEEMRESPSAFVRRFESWFSDNVGFRESLIRFHKALDSCAPLQYDQERLNWLTGQQGHLFLYHNIPVYRGKPLVSEAELGRLTDWLNETQRYLDERNIPFVTMLCTDKESIYPEYYPKAIMRGPGPSQLEVLTDYLLEHTEVDLFNIRQCLWAEKRNYLLYNKTHDFGHYNEIGAYFAYVELQKHIQAYFPEMSPLPLDDFEITYGENGVPDITPKAEAPYRKLGDSFFDDDFLLDWPYPWANAAYQNEDPSLPTILVLRDSYCGFYDSDTNRGGFISKYIPYHFGYSIFIHYANARSIEKFVTWYRPDIVVFEIVDRILPEFFGYIADFQYTDSIAQ